MNPLKISNALRFKTIYQDHQKKYWDINRTSSLFPHLGHVFLLQLSQTSADIDATLTFKQILQLCAIFFLYKLRDLWSIFSSSSLISCSSFLVRRFKSHWSVNSQCFPLKWHLHSALLFFIYELFKKSTLLSFTLGLTPRVHAVYTRKPNFPIYWIREYGLFPAWYSTKLKTGGLRRQIQPLTLLHTIFDRKWEHTLYWQIVPLSHT